MNLVIFGATGTVGRHLVSQALAEGHRVTAFARHPEVLDLNHERLNSVAGDVLDSRAVSLAVEGQDVALIALGAGRKGQVRAEGTRNVVNAARQHGLSRIICMSTLGAGDSRPNLNFFWKRIMFGLLLKEAYADHEAQEVVLRGSGLDWTIVRPGAFTDGPATGKFQHGFSAAEKGLAFKISRADVAGFMLRQLAENTYLQRAVALSY